MIRFALDCCSPPPLGRGGRQASRGVDRCRDMTLGSRPAAGAASRQEVGKCQTLLKALFYQPPNFGQLVTYGWSIKGDELDDQRQRPESGLQARKPKHPRRPNLAPAIPATEPGPTAGRWSHPYVGRRVRVCRRAGKRTNETAGAAGSDTEPGLIVAGSCRATRPNMLHGRLSGRPAGKRRQPDADQTRRGFSEQRVGGRNSAA